MNDKTLDSPKSVMLVLHAAVIVEAETWQLDATSQDDLKYLREMTSVTANTLQGPEKTWTIDQDEKTEWLLDYRQRLSTHLIAGVPPDAISKRMDRTMASFKVWGYNKHYAGYENQFRVRFCKMAGSGTFAEVPADIWQSAPIQREAANYMTFTDYHEAELKRCGM